MDMRIVVSVIEISVFDYNLYVCVLKNVFKATYLILTAIEVL